MTAEILIGILVTSNVLSAIAGLGRGGEHATERR